MPPKATKRIDWNLKPGTNTRVSLKMEKHMGHLEMLRREQLRILQITVLILIKDNEKETCSQKEPILRL